MKKVFLPLLIVVALLSAGCSIPIKKDSGEVVNATTKSEETSPENAVIDDSSEQAVVQEPTEFREDVPKLALTLYYQDKDGNVIPVTRRVTKQEGIARVAANGLIDSAASREELDSYGLFPVLPPDTQILGMTIKDGLALIDFNEALLEYESEMAEKSIISSIVYTLTEFKTIQRVKILVKGKPLGKLTYGTDASSEFSRENLMINSKKLNAKQGVKKVDLYFMKGAGDNFVYMLPVSIELSGVKPENIAVGIFNSLVKGSADKKLLTELPPKAKLLGSSIKDKVLVLNFSEELIKYGGTTREDGIINQILFTARQIEGIKSVKVVVNGKEEPLPEGTDIPKAFPLPVEINDYIDT